MSSAGIFRRIKMTETKIEMMFIINDSTKNWIINSSLDAPTIFLKPLSCTRSTDLDVESLYSRKFI